mgnify:FL=1
MNKTLLNIAGIISLIFGIICTITIIGAIVGVPMIIGGNKLRELSNMDDSEIYKNKDTLIIWMVVFLFINQISAVLVLIYYIMLESSMNSDNTKENTMNKYDELEKLNNLYKEKVLTKEEFEKEKERILNS